MKTSSTEINGKKVTIVLLKALEGIKISSQISKVALPAITALQASDGDMTKLASAVVNSLDEIAFDKIILKLFDGATVDDFPLKVDDYFSGNYGELITFLTFALKENFASFFSQDALSGLFTESLKA